MKRLRAWLRSATFARHVASLGGGRIAASAVSAIWLVVAARRLSLPAFGDLATLLSVGAISMTLADLGLPFLLADAVARHGRISWSTIAAAVRRRLVATAAMAAAATTAYLAVASDDRLVIPLVFSVSLLATAVYSTMSAAMRGLGRFSIEASNEVLSRLGVLVAGSLLLTGGGGLLAVVAVYAVADIVSVLAVTAAVSRHVAAEDDIDARSLTAGRNAATTAGRFLATLYYRVDLWLISLLRGPAAAGAYGAPYRLLDAVLLVPRAMGAVVVTHAGQRECRGLPPRSPRTVALAAAAVVATVAVPCMVFAAPLVRLVFGARYASSAGLLAVLMASAIPGAVASAFTPLAVVRYARRFAVVVGIALAVNVVLNLLFVPAHGPIAAAWITLVCQLGLGAALYRMLSGAPSPPPCAAAPRPEAVSPAA